RIGAAVSGEQSIRTVAPYADHLIAVEPNPDLIDTWAREERTSGSGRRIGQLPVCWGPDKDAAVRTAHEQFRWFAGGWKVNAELPGTAAFDAATQFVTEDDVADNIPCGPDTDAIVAAVRGFEEAGFTDVALIQVGDASQEDFLGYAEAELLPALR